MYLQAIRDGMFPADFNEYWLVFIPKPSPGMRADAVDVVAEPGGFRPIRCPTQLPMSRSCYLTSTLHSLPSGGSGSGRFSRRCAPPAGSFRRFEPSMRDRQLELTSEGSPPTPSSTSPEASNKDARAVRLFRAHLRGTRGEISVFADGIVATLARLFEGLHLLLRNFALLSAAAGDLPGEAQVG